MNIHCLLLIFGIPFIQAYLCGCGSCRGINGKACARCCTAYVKRSSSFVEKEDAFNNLKEDQTYNRIYYPNQLYQNSDDVVAEVEHSSAEWKPYLRQLHEHWSPLADTDVDVQKSLIDILGVYKNGQ